MGFLNRISSFFSNLNRNVGRALQSGQQQSLLAKPPSSQAASIGPETTLSSQAPNISTVLGPARSTIGGSIFQSQRGRNVDITESLARQQTQLTAPVLNAGQQGFINQSTGRVLGTRSRARNAAPSSRTSSGSKDPGRVRNERLFRENVASQTVAQGGTSAFGGQSIAPTGDPGGGGSRFFGTGGAVSGLGTPSVAQASDELEEFTKLRQKGLVSGDFSIAQQQAILGLEEAIPGVNISVDPGPQADTSPLNANVQREIPAGSLGAPQPSTITSFLSGGQVTRQQFQEEAQAIISQMRQQIDQAQPTPPEPVVDDVAQLEFIESSDDPFGVSQAIDDFKRSETNLMQLEADRIELKKDIQAITEGYRKIAKDIKDNPDLPKGLAQRRLAQMNEQQGEAMIGFINQLELLDDEIQGQNEQVNRAFNLVSNQQAQARQFAQDSFQRLQFILDSGAQISDNALRALAENAGVDFGSAKSVLKQTQKSNQPVTADQLQSLQIGGFNVLLGPDGVISSNKAEVGTNGPGPIPGSTPQTFENILRQASEVAGSLPDATSRNSALGGLATFQNAQDILDLLDAGVTTGPLAGRSRGGLSAFGIPILPGKRAFGKTSEQEDEFAAASTVFTANFIKAISGAQVSDKEREFLEAALPSENNQESVNRANLKMLTQFLKNDLENRLGLDLDPLLPGSQQGTERVDVSTSASDYINSLGL